MFKKEFILSCKQCSYKYQNCFCELVHEKYEKCNAKECESVKDLELFAINLYKNASIQLDILKKNCLGNGTNINDLDFAWGKSIHLSKRDAVNPAITINDLYDYFINNVSKLIEIIEFMFNYQNEFIKASGNLMDEILINLVEMLVVKLCDIYDKSKDSKHSLYKIYSQINHLSSKNISYIIRFEANGKGRKKTNYEEKIDTNEITKLLNQVFVSVNNLDMLKKYRDKYIVHFDQKYEEIIYNVQPTFVEIKKLYFKALRTLIALKTIFNFEPLISTINADYSFHYQDFINAISSID